MKNRIIKEVTNRNTIKHTFIKKHKRDQDRFICSRCGLNIELWNTRVFYYIWDKKYYDGFVSNYTNDNNKLPECFTDDEIIIKNIIE